MITTDGHGGFSVSEQTLASGVPVVVEERAGARVSTVSVWVRCGGRHERSGEEGCTHLLEHMLFRGKRAEDNLDVAVERLGGTANAATAKEFLALYATVPARAAGPTLALLAERVLDPPLPAAALAVEKAVVAEELAGAAADPADLVHDACYAALFGDDRLALPVGGTQTAVQALTHDTLVSFHRERVHQGTLGLAVVGSMTATQVADTLAPTRLARARADATDGQWRSQPLPGQPVPPLGRLLPAPAAAYHYVMVGLAAGSYAGEDRLAVELVAELLGGGSSSALFEHFRTDLGWAYDVNAVHVPLTDSGTVRAGIGVSPEHSDEVARRCATLVPEWLAAGWDAERVARARVRAAGRTLRESESSEDAVNLYGRNVLVGGLSGWRPWRHAEALEAVAAADVNRVARTLADRVAVVVAGKGTPEVARWPAGHGAAGAGA